MASHFSADVFFLLMFLILICPSAVYRTSLSESQVARNGKASSFISVQIFVVPVERSVMNKLVTMLSDA